MITKIILTLAIIFYITNQVESSSLNSEKDEENSELSQEIEETTTLETSESTSHHHDHKFDFILFAQVWPISNCIDWEERSEDNTCSLPSK